MPDLRILAIGDVHGQWAELWAALRAGGASLHPFEPTAQLVSGDLEVVLCGDLVHYKDAESYALAVGEEVFDAGDARQLRRAAKAQIRELYRFKDFIERACGHVTVLLGNHDEAALNHRYTLSTRAGLEHLEFDPRHGGLALPDELGMWMAAFPRQKVVEGVQFAHAGPLPGMRVYDDFFYHDPDTRNWWRTKPELVQQCGCRFGVYGHTVMAEGIHLDKLGNFAMIDALERREVLELDFGGEDLHVAVRRF